MIIRFLIGSTLALCAAGPASAVQQSFAVSMGDIPGCGNRLQVSTDRGTSVVIWPGRGMPRAGEDLRGNFRTLGWQNLTRADGETIRVYVEAVDLTGRQIMDWARRCLVPGR